MTERAFQGCLAAIAVLVIAGAGLDVMEVDAAQYAGMARDMVRRGDVLHLFYRDEPYLDKPPLLFWLSALSFKLFGVHNWSYRLPSILFAAMGLYSTYRFTLRYHGSEMARRATLMLGCSAAFILMTNDVRCDTMLMGAVITATWFGCAWIDDRRPIHAVLFAVAVALGMLAKGPLGAMAPALAMLCHLAHTRSWGTLRTSGMLLAAIVLALALLPMCIGLYQQHGWHGLRFFFWEQSFGRLTGENRWKDDSTVFYFTHEVLWQLLPWTVYVLVGCWHGLRALLTRTPLAEAATLGGALLVFCALSFSQFKLPHYLFVIAPHLAILGAFGWKRVSGQVLRRVQTALLSLLGTALLFFTFTVFPEQRWLSLVPVICLLGVAAWLWRSFPDREGAFAASFVVMFATGWVMNTYFYPNLLHFQANAMAGKWAAEHKLDPDRFHGMQISGPALDFYAGHPVKWLSHAGEARAVLAPGVTIYTDAVHRTELIQAGLIPVREDRLWNHPAQRIGLPFLFPEQRQAILEPRYLLHF